MIIKEEACTRLLLLGEVLIILADRSGLVGVRFETGKYFDFVSIWFGFYCYLCMRRRIEIRLVICVYFLIGVGNRICSSVFTILYFYYFCSGQHCNF